MLKAISTLALTNATTSDTSLITIAMVLAILAVLISLVAMSRARKAGKTANVAIDEALTTAAYPAGPSAAIAGPAVAAESDDRQLVAVISAAIAVMLADEKGAGATVSAPQINSIRRVDAPAAAAAAAAAAAPAYTRPTSGPYAGFVVRRIRRV